VQYINGGLSGCKLPEKRIPSSAVGYRRKGNHMVRNIEEVQQLGKEQIDATMKSFGACSKSMQAIAVELADYSKRVFEQGTAATEKLIGAKSLDKAFEVQSDFVKNSYEGFVAQATKLGELYTDLAKEAYKPFETQFGKFPSAVK
jgi:hypothetical protein